MFRNALQANTCYDVFFDFIEVFLILANLQRCGSEHGRCEDGCLFNRSPRSSSEQLYDNTENLCEDCGGSGLGAEDVA